MHIDVEAQTQMLSAHRMRKLQPQEIDWFLNSTQTTMLSSCVVPVQNSPRFEIDRGKREMVEQLIAGRTQVAAGWFTDRYISILPPDCHFLLDDGSSVVPLCKGDIKTISHTILSITSVQFPKTTATQDFYKSVEVVYNNQPLINLTSEMSSRMVQWTGLDSVEEHFYIKDLLIDMMWQKGIQVYWERFSDIYLPYNFLFVTASAAVPVVIKLDGQDYSSSTQQRTLENHQSSKTSMFSPNTMVSPDRSMPMSATPYFRSSYISPISELQQGTIATYSDSSFIVCGTTVNYIRKPRPISLILGTDCSLSATVHQELCNRTAELILNRINSPSWKEQTEANVIQKTQ